ncbi:acyltransferase [Chloroflexota bacterium]
MISKRDRRNLDEIAKQSNVSKASFIMKYARNWLLKQLASSFPIPTWRATLHRMRGMRIGKDVFIGSQVIFDEIYPELITIEDYVELGDGCKVYAHAHGPALLRNLYPRTTAPIKIGRSVWIAPGCIILPGVTIGECSVIGAGSIVTQSIPPYSVAVGSPAKVIKTLNVDEVAEPFNH